MAVKPVTSRSSELCERAARACADHFGRKSDAHDWVLQSLLAR